MDLGRQLKLAIATGTLLFGVKQTQDACARGEARMVIFAANCPEDVTSDLRARHPELLFHRTDLVNRELGTACSKPFAVSTICITDAGRRDLMGLRPNFDD